MTDPTHPADGNPTNLRHCTVGRCRRPFYARGMCATHYQRWLAYGTPTPMRAKGGRRLPASFKRTTG